MPKHKTRNSKHSLLMKFGQFMLCYKKRMSKNFAKTTNCVCKELSTTSIGK